jgi:hypothetical protein
MFAFARRPIRNELTALFDGGKMPTLEAVLLCGALSTSVRNEVTELLNFIVNRDEPDQSKLPQLLDLALTKKSTNYQLRRNAATVLSDASKQLHQRLRSYPKPEAPLIYERLIGFPDTDPMSAEDCELAGHYARIFAAVNRQGDGEILDRVKNLATTLFNHFHVTGYQELYVSLVEDSAAQFLEASPNAFIGLAELARTRCGRPMDGNNYRALYNVSGAIHALSSNSADTIAPFRKEPIFRQLLEAAVTIGREAISFATSDPKLTKTQPNMFALVSYAFRGLQLLYYQVEDLDEAPTGSDPPRETVFGDLETVVQQVSKDFTFQSEADKPTMDVQMAMFPLLYPAGMRPMLAQFFEPNAVPMFCRYYLASLARIPRRDAEYLIRHGLIKQTIGAFPFEAEEGRKKIMYLPDNYFAFEMAETIINRDKLNLNDYPGDKSWPLNSREWAEVATRVGAQRHFLRKKLDEARDDRQS